MKKNKNPAAVSLGRRGGIKTKKKYGKKYFKKLAEKRWRGFNPPLFLSTPRAECRHFSDLYFLAGNGQRH